MSESERIKDLVSEAKKKRRNCKAGITRLGNVLDRLINEHRDKEEITEIVLKIDTVFDNLVEKHTDYTQMLDDDNEFDVAEAWLDEVQTHVTTLKIYAKDYLKTLELKTANTTPTKSNKDTDSVENLPSPDQLPASPQTTPASNQPDSVNINISDPVLQNVPTSANPVVDVYSDPNNSPDNVANSTNETAAAIPSNENPAVIPSDYDNIAQDIPVYNEPRNGRSVGSPSNSVYNIPVQHTDVCSFKMEKPKMPKFSGDVREYFTFKSDFLHMIGSRYSKRDAITLLRSCLMNKPFDLIRGIGCDYDAAFEYLDSIYGDPRFITDTITQDINRFRPLRDGEDSRFCDLVHLIRRSYNTLKEIGRPNDMNNNHMLAIIEQKMNIEDRKVWFRHLEREKQSASLEDLLDWMTTEMKSRIRANAPIRSNHQPSKYNVNHVASSESQNSNHFKCWLCKNSAHWVDQCQKFTAMKIDDRLKAVKNNHACFSCLKIAGRDHNLSTCSRRCQCTKEYNGSPCKMFHNPLLHRETSSHNVGVASVVNRREAILPILMVELVGYQNYRLKANLLFDSGAQISLIRFSLAEELQLNGKDISITLTKVGGDVVEMTTKLFRVTIRSIENNSLYTVTAVGIPSISGDIQGINLLDIAGQFGLKANNLFRVEGTVDLLIGIDHVRMHSGEIRESDNLIARHSPLGWVIYGATMSDKPIYENHIYHVAMSVPVDMTEFWSTESMGVTRNTCNCKPSKLSPVELEEYRIIEDSCQKIGNQWLVPYPWKNDPKLLPDNQSQAECKLKSTEQRLLKSPEHARIYDEQMMELVEMKFAKQLTESEVENYHGPVHYISHHAVVRPEKKSTPVRIVFNSSANYQGHCLNEYWMKGPDLLNNLFGVILRFRQHEVVICADISKMYHRVLIPEADQHVHRFLWRNLKIENKPDVYIKTVLTFGDKPAPAMAQIALTKTAKEAETLFPKAAQVLKENTYMDDICASVTNIEGASKLTLDIDQVLAQGGFKVKGWTSNKMLFPATETESTELKLLESMSEEKVLGVVWNNVKDVFTFKYSSVDTKTLESLTKRRILSQIAKIFDPIGLAAAFLIRMKIGMQKLWQMGLDWDESLPQSVHTDWTSLFTEMNELNCVEFERCLTPVESVGLPVLCIFSDASDEAFGASAYLRWKTDFGYAVRFVAAKSRVAPLKKLTIPRLELQAAVMSARLYKFILEEIRMNIEKTVFFVDSTIVLAWIQGLARKYKPSVSARIGEIQDITDSSEWLHIRSEDNVADDISRGISVQQLTKRWKHGPEFLYTEEENWPTDTIKPTEGETQLETRKIICVNAVTVKESIMDSNSYSSFNKLLRVTAYVRRFIYNLLGKIRNKDTCKEPLSAEEIVASEIYWIKQGQIGLHDRHLKGEFKSLSPFTDENGIIRVGGRLKEAVISFESKHPVLLPNNHRISLLITRHYHNQGHLGIAATVAKIRRKYWILKVHKLSKTVKFRCVTCREFEHRTESQFMTDLPKFRLAPFTPPFYNTAVDYFGPYSVKFGRNKTTKHYGVLFTCLNTRSVHLELAVDYSTQAFLQVLRRFFSIRGTPTLMISDNGSQLVES